MTSDGAKKTIEGLLKQKPIGDDDVVFMIVGTLDEKMTNIHGEPVPAEFNEWVLVAPHPRDFALGTWLCSVAEGIRRGAVYEDAQHVLEDFRRSIAVPDEIHEFRTVAVKVYKETSQGDAQGLRMRWDFVADLDVYHND